MPEWVFGYGSLVSPREAHAMADLGAPVPIELDGYRREWTVAMRNSAPENDAKHYVDPETGDRPDIYVVFLNVVPANGARCNGVAIPVDTEGLARFDEREVNYERIEVTDGVAEEFEGRVWTYTASRGGAERFRTGSRAGTAYIPDEYMAYCVAAFRERGEALLARFHATTAPPTVPQRSLKLLRASRLTGF